jgi:hypothetical protein
MFCSPRVLANAQPRWGGSQIAAATASRIRDHPRRMYREMAGHHAGYNCSPWTARPAPGNPNARGCACFPRWTPSPQRPMAAAGRELPLGRPAHRRNHPPARLRSRLISQPSLRPGKETAGPWNSAHPARQPGSQTRPPAETSHPPQPQPDTSRSRNIKPKHEETLVPAAAHLSVR